MERQGIRSLMFAAAALALGGCGDSGGAGVGPHGPGGNVGFGGGQDFAAFRDALAHNLIPRPETLDSGGFFAEHFTSLPPPACGQPLCLHGMLAVAPDFARKGDWTLLQLAMNTPLDPDKTARPPLDVAVVLDRSGSMGADNKMQYARDGVKLLVDQLGEKDTFTLIAFDDKVERLFGPSVVINKEQLKQMIGNISPRGATNIYDALDAGYKAVISAGNETQLRRVIFLTDGLPTAGNTSKDAITKMSLGYNVEHVGLTTIGLGVDVDAPFLRGLAERGGGNFYFVEKPAAVTEVFTEELKFFVAPIAYDVDLVLERFPAYDIAGSHGSGLWQPSSTGGKIHLPTVYLTSRTETMPDPNGGRRGGGSALIHEMKPNTAITGAHGVGRVKLSYRRPGADIVDTQELVVNYAGTAGVAPEGGYYTDPSVEKNAIVLDFFVAFRDATQLAQTKPDAALAYLESFKPRAIARLAGRSDEDLLDDLTLVQKFIDVLQRAAGK